VFSPKGHHKYFAGSIFFDFRGQRKIHFAVANGNLVVPSKKYQSGAFT
jgi:hypothetical protein